MRNFKNQKKWGFIVAQISITILIIFLSFYRLGVYPKTWFDEGIHLLIAKELAIKGTYQFNAMVGPMVILPVAAALKIGGLNLIVARVVIAIYMLLMIFAVYLLSGYLINKKTALINCLFLVLIPSVNLLNWGRQILGEVPAVFFLILGTFIWGKIVVQEERKKDHLFLLIFSGFLFSLSILSKYQMLLIIPAWLFFWLMSFILNKNIEHKIYLIPFLSMGFITIVWLLIVNSNTVREVQDYQQMLSRGILNLSFSRILSSGKFLISNNNFSGLFLPAITIYAGYNVFNRGRKNIIWGWLFIFSVFWLSWFVLFSVGWQRYAFPVLVIGTIFISSFLSELTENFKILSSIRSNGNEISPLNFEKIKNFVIIGMLFCIFVFYILDIGLEIYRFDDYSPIIMAEYLSENIDQDAVIETYEPEVCFLSGANCHIPPEKIMDISISYIWYGGNPPKNYYTYLENNPDYLLIGEFGEWVDLYDMAIVNENFTILTDISNFHLYERN